MMGSMDSQAFVLLAFYYCVRIINFITNIVFKTINLSALPDTSVIWQ